MTNDKCPRPKEGRAGKRGVSWRVHRQGYRAELFAADGRGVFLRWAGLEHHSNIPPASCVSHRFF